MKNALFIAVFAWLAACKTASSPDSGAKAAPTASTPRLSLNDVSILFPFHNKGDQAQQLSTSDMPHPENLAGHPPAAPLDNQSFVPQPFLAQLDQEVQKDAALRQKENLKAWQELDPAGVSETSLFKDAVLQATAVRIEPCANALVINGDVSLCAPQLLVIWQSGAADLNVRAAYRLDNDDLYEVALTLVGLSAASKLSYAASPLQIHPVIVRQGSSGSYYQGVIGLLQRYARASRLVSLSALANAAPSDAAALFSWVMLELSFQNGQPSGRPLVAVAVGANEAAKVVQRQPGRPTPDLHDATGSQVNSLGLPTPLGSSSETLFPGGDLVNASGVAVSAHLAHIESPLQHGQSSLDCATCHRTMTIRKQLKIDADATAAYKSTHWDLSNSTSIAALPYTALQMFSYRGDQLTGSTPFLPVISQRVIHETAFAVDFINDRVLTKIRLSP